jgi:hypothetical protein
MTTSIDHSRNEILVEVRAKRASALRLARAGSLREQEYWLYIASRMTAWIEHLEESGDAHNIPIWPHGQGGAHLAIDLPPSARRSRAPAVVMQETAANG